MVHKYWIIKNIWTLAGTFETHLADVQTHIYAHMCGIFTWRACGARVPPATFHSIYNDNNVIIRVITWASRRLKSPDIRLVVEQLVLKRRPQRSTWLVLCDENLPLTWRPLSKMPEILKAFSCDDAIIRGIWLTSQLSAAYSITQLMTIKSIFPTTTAYFFICWSTNPDFASALKTWWLSWPVRPRMTHPCCHVIWSYLHILIRHKLCGHFKWTMNNTIHRMLVDNDRKSLLYV